MKLFLTVMLNKLFFSQFTHFFLDIYLIVDIYKIFFAVQHRGKINNLGISPIYQVLEELYFTLC